jgi:bifunctional UDP-N-acetylglucosamine pyrophosphorylase/glucosamine-1-phosphate N-acetyltransferase
MLNPETIDISPESTVGMDSLLEAGVKISDDSHLGKSCKIGQGAILKDCNIGDNVTIGPYSYLVNSTIEAGSTLEAYSK